MTRNRLILLSSCLIVCIFISAIAFSLFTKANRELTAAKNLDFRVHPSKSDIDILAMRVLSYDQDTSVDTVRYISNYLVSVINEEDNSASINAAACLCVLYQRTKQPFLVSTLEKLRREHPSASVKEWCAVGLRNK
jgi:hypothetical protein